MSTTVSEAEFAMLEERARANGLMLSEWVRDVLLSAPVDGVPEANEIVLAELLALRSLFLNLSFRAGKEPMTEAEMRGLIERADSVKMQRARERLTAVRAEQKEQEETQPGAEMRDGAQECKTGKIPSKSGVSVNPTQATSYAADYSAVSSSPIPMLSRYSKRSLSASRLLNPIGRGDPVNLPPLIF